jgi:hypothetical protein
MFGNDHKRDFWEIFFDMMRKLAKQGTQMQDTSDRHLVRTITSLLSTFSKRVGLVSDDTMHVLTQGRKKKIAW